MHNVFKLNDFFSIIIIELYNIRKLLDLIQ